MAKELQFKLGGQDYGAAPVKLERKKIYGWTDLAATDKSGEVCNSAYLSPDDALIIPSGEVEGMGTKLEGSTLLERRVFKKVSGGKVMLHKFFIWKTNKEQSGRYPAYVFYHTDFSSGRKDMIKRDMAYSSDEKQIREIFAAEIAENVKKGWEEV